MIKTKSNIYQFKITLKGIKPKIWRRIQVSANCTFQDLHMAIQSAMGWYDCHLHQFEMKTHEVFGMIIGTEECDQLENKAKISKYFQFLQDKALYEYDFGDGWEHEIVLEKILPQVIGDKYPKCIAGKRACPPEDCGGIWGYENLLSVIKNPNDAEYEEMMEWLDDEFDPEKFDPSLVDFERLGF
jgi:hypothetical protein